MSNQHAIRIKRFLASIGFLLAFFVVSPIYAVDVVGLYDIDIPVSDQSAETRQQAFKQAIEQVMVRISGNTMIAETPGVEKLTALASRYVRKFQYRVITESDELVVAEALLLLESQEPQVQKVPKVPKVPKAPKATRILAVQFDGSAIQTQLRGMNITTWGANRPAVLVWVGVEQRRQRQIISDSEFTEVRKMLERSAQRRGIPLIFPQMDLEDQANIKFADIRGNYSPSIRMASNRYEADIVLAGFMSRNGAGRWSADWTVYRDNVSSGWSAGDKLSTVVSSAIDGVTDILVSRYGESSAQQGSRFELVLQVDQITNTEDYAKSFEYLSSLSVVESVQPFYISGNVIQYKLLIRGAPHHLERAISLKKTLLPLDISLLNAGQTSVLGTAQLQADMYYRLYH